MNPPFKKKKERNYKKRFIPISSVISSFRPMQPFQIAHSRKPSDCPCFGFLVVGCLVFVSLFWGAGLFVWFLWWLQEKQLCFLNTYWSLTLDGSRMSFLSLSFLQLIRCIGFTSLHLQCLKFGCPSLSLTPFISKRWKWVPPKGNSSSVS